MRHPATLRSMSPMRAVLLSLCTLLIGAGTGVRRHPARRLGRRRRRRRERRGHDRRATRRSGGADRFRRLRRADETFGCYQRGFRALVTAQDPGVALDKLDALSKTDSYVLRTCHPLAHEIGHLAFAKYKTVQAAEGFARETCWSGYHHGVMESYISQFNDGQLRDAHERHLQAGRRTTPTRSPTTTAGTASATGSRSASRSASSSRSTSATT